jgi:hypothetical protein
MVGILPSVSQQDLTLVNMSEMKRYRALNEQVLRLREGKPLMLDIHGREHLNILHHDVMLESATTSLQLHLKVAVGDAVRYYNAAQIVSAPLVAASANSPYLFGKDLWDETRIPLRHLNSSAATTAPKIPPRMLFASPSPPLNQRFQVPKARLPKANPSNSVTR